MKKKKILVVYPNNFLQGRQGTNNRVFQLISIFKELNFVSLFFFFKNINF